MRGLSVEGLGLRYTGSPPVFSDVSFSVEPGACVALVGGNGSGKSALLSILAGLVPEFVRGEVEGRALFDGRPLAEEPWRPACVRQNVDAQILSDTVREELGFFLRYGGGRAGSSPEAAAAAMGIEDLLERRVHRLSGGEKQRFALCAALCFADPRLVLLDEPASFLDAEGRARLRRLLDERKRAGSALLLAGHEFQGLEDLLDRTVRLDAAPPEPPSPGSGSSTASPPAGEGELLRARDLGAVLPAAGRVFGGLSFSLPRGAVVGLHGPNGCGKSTLARLLCGLAAPAEGSLELEGRRADPAALRDAAALVPQNPYHRLLHRTVGDELAALERRAALMSPAEGARRLGLEGLLRRDPQTLCFGEAQKTAILCAALRCPRLLVVDEPLFCLDPAAREQLDRLFAALASRGSTVLLISHVEEFLEGSCASRVSMGDRCRAPIA